MLKSLIIIEYIRIVRSEIKPVVVTVVVDVMVFVVVLIWVDVVVAINVDVLGSGIVESDVVSSVS